MAVREAVPVRYSKSAAEAVRFELHEGDRVRVELREADWARVSTFSGERGWAPAADLVFVGPPYDAQVAAPARAKQPQAEEGPPAG